MSTRRNFGATPWNNPVKWLAEQQLKADQIAQSQGYQDYEDYTSQLETAIEDISKPSDIDKPQPTIRNPYVGGPTGTPNIRPNPIIDSPVPDYKTPINVPNTFKPPLGEDMAKPDEDSTRKPLFDDDPSLPNISKPSKTTTDTKDVPEAGEDQTMMYVLYGMLAIVGIGAAFFLYQSATTPAPRPYIPPAINLRASEYFEPSVYDAVDMLPPQ